MSNICVGPAVAALVMLASCGNAEPSGGLIGELNRLAEAGDREAIYHIGMAYQTGTGVVADPERALAAFQKAASLGDALASYKLGCFYDGQGGDLVAQDPALALRYKLVAAEAGYALAQQDVAVLYVRKGETDAALRWLEKATAQGWSGALAAYASAYNGAAGIAPDAARTAAYFRLFLDRTGASGTQEAWLEDFEGRMSAADRQRASAIVAGYRAAPTPITIRALSGQRAAEALVNRAR